MSKYVAFCVLAVLAGSAGASSVGFTVSGWGPTQYPGPITPPASAPWGVNGYPGDTVELTTGSGTLDLTPGNSYDLKVNTLLWAIDYTYAGTETDPDAWSDLAATLNIARSISFDGGASGSLAQSGLLEITWENDFLTVNNGTTTVVNVAGYPVEITPLGLQRTGGTFDGGNPWAQQPMDVLARFTVLPEPASATLLVLGGLAVIRRRR